MGLLKRGIPYHIAKIFVLEKEEVEMHKPTIRFHLKDGHIIEFFVSRINPVKVYNFLDSRFKELECEKKLDTYLLLETMNP